MSLDIVNTVVHVSEAFAQVSHEEVSHQRLGLSIITSLIVLVEALGELEFTLKDVVVNVHGIFISERIDASVHLVDEYTQGPPICGLPMSLVEQDLRGQVFGCSA